MRGRHVQLGAAGWETIDRKGVSPVAMVRRVAVGAALVGSALLGGRVSEGTQPPQALQSSEKTGYDGGGGEGERECVSVSVCVRVCVGGLRGSC